MNRSCQARDLSGRDRLLYRLFELIPGALTWITLLGVVFFSWFWPFGTAIFIIAFDVYWLVKTAYLSAHLRATWKRMRRSLKVNWRERVAELGEKSDTLWQCIFLPMYKEERVVVEGAVASLMRSEWPKNRMIVVLATEARAGENAQQLARELQSRYGSLFAEFLVTVHPDKLSGEIPGKGSNTAYAAQIVKSDIIDRKHIPVERVLVSSFDIDTQVPAQYFHCLAYYFLTTPNPHQASYQPIPVYSNNIWDAPAVSRVVAMSGTFWQMMQQARPERLTTFSS
ncbi:MAG: hypothetical protein HYU35_01735, partial [Parcubacteria group bacterium]|nr:hypothetical protein [Parcubacteria group bacterium]